MKFLIHAPSYYLNDRYALWRFSVYTKVLRAIAKQALQTWHIAV